jgi:hypothetical protein
MKPENAGKVKYGVWGLVCGAVIAMVVGFSWGGWTTATTTKKMTADAVLASQSAICVAQFMKQPGHEEKLKDFESEKSWERYKFIENGGWDKMPGQESADASVSRACSDGIELLVQK